MKNLSLNAVANIQISRPARSVGVYWSAVFANSVLSTLWALGLSANTDGSRNATKDIKTDVRDIV